MPTACSSCALFLAGKAQRAMGKKKKAVATWLAGIEAGQSGGDLIVFLELKDLLSGTHELKVGPPSLHITISTGPAPFSLTPF